MKNFLLGIVCVAMFVTACSTDDGTPDDSNKTIKMERLEFDGAKYLSLTGPVRAGDGISDTEVGLFKIDDQGNVSTVVLSCTETENGVTQVIKDIDIIPKHLVSISGIYTLMLDCDFRISENLYFDMRAYYEPDSYGPFNILVQNVDGKIFYIPQSASKYFENADAINTAFDAKGTAYMVSGRDLLSIVYENENLLMKQVNPDGVVVEGNEIWPLDNGTIVVNSSGDLYSFFYPNGGFEQVFPSDEGRIYYLAKAEDGIKAIELEERDGTPQKEYTVTFNDYYVGQSVGQNSFSPISFISSGTAYSTDLGDANYLDWVSKVQINWKGWVYPMYESEDRYLLGQSLVVDKRTLQISALDWDQSNSVIFPTKDNVYKGLAWSVSSSDASWFNIKTMESGVVPFDFSEVGDFYMTDYFVNIPFGEVILTGVLNSNGKQIICKVDIETGHIVCAENDGNYPITELVPLN